MVGCWVVLTPGNRKYTIYRTRGYLIGSVVTLPIKNPTHGFFSLQAYFLFDTGTKIQYLVSKQFSTFITSLFEMTFLRIALEKRFFKIMIHLFRQLLLC
ncbi:MAG: hypothetical protein JSC161_000820 [Candidatus Tokpelaia sp. JSC161]|jgi:hypothetical protein|nr:MAG: hypothetical protein JSC161_000820 [Candidatus Tokpelaia sp. JSC161]